MVGRAICAAPSPDKLDFVYGVGMGDEVIIG